MAVDVPDMVAKFMESQEDIDTVRKMRSLESSHGEVLCVVKDEISVNIMFRKLCCNFLWKSRL
jgi:hypothetical protein